MKKSYLYISSCLLLFVVLFTSCKKDDVENPLEPETNLVKIFEGNVPGASMKMELYSKTQLQFTGYSKFYITLRDSASGNRIENANILVMPMMDMGMMQHSSPFENPTSQAVNKMFPLGVVFTMPSSTTAHWIVNFTITANTHSGTVSVPLNIVDPSKSRLKSFTSAFDGSVYIAALIDPASPKVGINDMEIAIFKKNSMMSYPADSSMSITLTPEMPSMGHGSPNNISPVHTKVGHYNGKVNFTMTGLWRLNLDFMSGQAVADTTQFFDIEF